MPSTQTSKPLGRPPDREEYLLSRDNLDADQALALLMLLGARFESDKMLHDSFRVFASFVTPGNIEAYLAQLKAFYFLGPDHEDFTASFYQIKDCVTELDAYKHWYHFKYLPSVKWDPRVKFSEDELIAQDISRTSARIKSTSEARVGTRKRRQRDKVTPAKRRELSNTIHEAYRLFDSACKQHNFDRQAAIELYRAFQVARNCDVAIFETEFRLFLEHIATFTKSQ